MRKASPMAAGALLRRMVRERADWIVSVWRQRANGKREIVELFGGEVTRELVEMLLRDYADLLMEGPSALSRASPAPRVLETSPRKDPRFSAAAWIELFAVGRETLEDFLQGQAVPTLGLGSCDMEGLMDDLEAAFRLLAHKRVHCLCEGCLSLMERPVARGGLQCQSK